MGTNSHNNNGINCFIRFLIRHEIKIFILSVMVFIIGSFTLPSELDIGKVWVKSFDMVIGPRIFNTIYFLFSIPLYGLLFTLFYDKNESLCMFSIPVLMLLIVIYGLLSYLYSTIYVYSSICMLMSCIIGLLSVRIDYLREKNIY